MIFDSKYDRAMEWLRKQDNGHGHKNGQNSENIELSEDNKGRSSIADSNKEELPDMETIRAEALMDYEEEEIKPGWKDILAMVLSAFMMIVPVALIIFAMVCFVAWFMFLR